jgi:hypothetical protein
VPHVVEVVAGEEQELEEEAVVGKGEAKVNYAERIPTEPNIVSAKSGKRR